MVGFCTKTIWPWTFLVGLFLMTIFISLGVMELFRLPDFDLNMVHGICLENHPFHLDFPVLLSIGFCNKI